MNHKEFRPGNLVNVSGKPEAITGILQFGMYFHLMYYPFNLSQIEPILLTEDWFNDLGFENGYKQYEWTNYGMYAIKGLSDDYILYQGFGNQKHELTNVKYVHKLQNVWFELSGEELHKIS